MQEIIAEKETKASFGTLIMLFLLALLILITVFRIATWENYNITIKVILIGLLILGIFYFVKELIELIKNLKTPKELIVLKDSQLLIYVNQKLTNININDIKMIEKGTLYNKNFLFYQATIVIRTQEKSYPVRQVKNLEEVLKSLNAILNNDVQR